MSHLQFFIPLLCTFTISQSLPAQAPKAEKPKQFIYLLGLVPRLLRTQIGRKKIKQCLGVTSLDSKKPQYRVN